MPHQLIWLILLLPLFSFLIISFFIRPFVSRESKVAGYITILAIGASFVLSVWALMATMNAPEHQIEIPRITWMVIPDGVTISLGLIMNSLTAVMLIVVTFVSLMVQIYSQGYMKDDPGYHRYYAAMSLFTMAMLGVVLADSLLLIFVFWELVGLCSYLLIGFWFHRVSAANAAKKAFIVTRIGDFGFLAAILTLYLNTGTFDIAQLEHLAVTGALAGATLTWAAIGIFAGAMGKSAQFPLHVWLPDAMEGPTPVSALIHAATMVAAGVFLVARTFPLFEHSTQALTTVAIIGGFTAIFAATMGLVMTDIKRVVAYSTISQLGYMMLGLGVGGVAVGIFHLFTHAFFKALLFLGSGSVNHATGTFDMRLMGGLRKYMPWTYATFVIGSISLAGFWPFAGFWSKDEILISALEKQPVLFVLALITVFMTAFYTFRAVFLTFGGDYRGGAQDAHSSHDSHHGKPHESGPVMVVPLVLLSILAVVAGWWNVTGGFGAFMGEGETHGFIEGLIHPLTTPLPWIAMAMGGLGILLAYSMYSAKWISPVKVVKIFKPFYTLLINKWYFDRLYEDVFVRNALMKYLFAWFQGTDSRGIEGVVNGIGKGAMSGGKALRRAETGQLQLYGLFIGIGVVVIALVLFLA